MDSFHINECSYTSSFLITKEHSTLWPYHCLFNQFLIDGPFCGFLALFFHIIDSVPVITLPYPVHFLQVPPWQSFIWDPLLTKYHLHFTFLVPGCQGAPSMTLWSPRFCLLDCLFACFCPWAPTDCSHSPLLLSWHSQGQSNHGCSWPPWLFHCSWTSGALSLHAMPCVLWPDLPFYTWFPLLPCNSGYIFALSDMFSFYSLSQFFYVKIMLSWCRLEHVLSNLWTLSCDFVLYRCARPHSEQSWDTLGPGMQVENTQSPLLFRTLDYSPM